MVKDLEVVADKKTNEIFTRWVCDECGHICEHVRDGNTKPIICPYENVNSEWNKLSLPIYITSDEVIHTFSENMGKSNFENRVSIRDRKDVKGRPFYDLYVDGKYEDSYVDPKDADKRKKEIIGDLVRVK